MSQVTVTFTTVMFWNEARLAGFLKEACMLLHVSCHISSQNRRTLIECIEDSRSASQQVMHVWLMAVLYDL